MRRAFQFPSSSQISTWLPATTTGETWAHERMGIHFIGGRRPQKGVEDHTLGRTAGPHVHTIISSCRAYSMTCLASSVEGMVVSSGFCCWLAKL